MDFYCNDTVRLYSYKVKDARIKSIRRECRLSKIKKKKKI